MTLLSTASSSWALRLFVDRHAVLPQRKCVGSQLTAVPANERSQGQWNTDPYDLTGGSGYSEYDAGAWLLPYWLARYYGLIVNQA